MNEKANIKNERSKRFIEIENRILKVLYPMHNLIEEGKLFPEWLELEAVNCIVATLNHPEATRKEMDEYSKYTKLIEIELKCNDLRKQLIANQEAREEFEEAERKLKKHFSRALPDHQATLGHA